MKKEEILHYIEELDAFLRKEEFKGYDPYDVLNSSWNLLRLGKMPAAVLTQIQKRNPINVRPLLGIKKDYNPKGMGLYLAAYSKLFELTGNHKYQETAHWIFDWLMSNTSKGFEGISWGYNFAWANPSKVVPRYSPNLVVTGFIAKGLFEYHRVFKEEKVVKVTKQIIQFIEQYLATTEDENGLCYSYTTLAKDRVYNASLQAGEVFAWYAKQTDDSTYRDNAAKIADFVIARQESDGSWAYAENENGERRYQLDFHQGYVIESLDFIQKTLSLDGKYDNAIQTGFDYYMKTLMTESGRTIYRFPKKYPVEIHNQSQAIISCSQFGEINLAEKTLLYTIENMRSLEGFYYYKKYPMFTIRTPYIRWSQAWMMVAMVELYSVLNQQIEKS